MNALHAALRAVLASGKQSQNGSPQRQAAHPAKCSSRINWATMKVEFYDRYLWPTRAAAKLAVGDWIERVYNRRRRHSALGMITRSTSKTDSLRRRKPPDPVSRGEVESWE